MAAPPRFMPNEYLQNPDDDSVKPVYLEAFGLNTAPLGADRHVLVWWANSGSFETSDLVRQVIQLTGNPGSYNYYSPYAEEARAGTLLHDKQYILIEGSTRAQRDEILELAKRVVYSKKSMVNSCRTWTKDLFIAMVGAGLMSQQILDDINTDVPLKDRIAEI